MTGERSERIGVPGFLGRIPTWQTNLLVFGVLIVLVLAYFYRQVQYAHQTFLDHVHLNTRLIAGVIERNARSAVLSQEVVEEIIRTFLGNSARFVDYLDRIEPFTPAELSAFAVEAGLAGIRISKKVAPSTEGPAGWFPEEQAACDNGTPSLRHLPDHHLYALARPRDRMPGCIVVGIAARRIETLQEQISLETLLEAISGLSGVARVRLETRSEGPGQPAVRLIETPDREVAEARLPMGDHQLVVGLDAREFFVRIRGLWREFFVFSAILAAFGLLLSWLLYRIQQVHFGEVRSFERQLARQREDAALGRAAASITHEIGNPLNAMGMGLQRLKMEAHALDPEHREIIDTMLNAVDRTRGIISGIRRYAKPLMPGQEPLQLAPLVQRVLSLYRQQCNGQSVAVFCDTAEAPPVAGDALLLEEVVENLVKNAIEAQPRGGEIRIRIGSDHASETFFSLENSGFDMDPPQIERILAPYFTTKTRGTGLGLSIAKRIVDAHGGRMVAETPRRGWLKITVFLPVAGVVARGRW